jgi:hypothetical protein
LTAQLTDAAVATGGSGKVRLLRFSTRRTPADAAQSSSAHRGASRTVQDEPCEICGGTGFRLPPPDIGAGDQFCNACDGLGQAPAPVRNYRLTVEAVEAFADFLHDCGGFTID